MALTILIVDDDQQFPGELRRLLESGRRPVRVVEARDGEEALRLALAVRPDIVVMDVVMPGMGGLEATRRIKASRPETKIVMVTVHDEAQYRKAAQESGADRFLLKKTLGTELIPAIRSLVPCFAPKAPDCSATGPAGSA